MDSLKTEVSATRAHPLPRVEIHSVDILAFVEAQGLSACYLATPYRLAPEQGGEQVYALLHDELRSSGKVGIARVVIGTRPYLAVLVPDGETLVLTTLRWANESGDGVRLPAGDSLHAPAVSRVAFDAGRTMLTELAMKEKKLGGFGMEEPDLFADDDDALIEQKYLMPALRRPRHPADGHALRGMRVRRQRLFFRRDRGR